MDGIVQYANCSEIRVVTTGLYLWLMNIKEMYILMKTDY
jgi:hypothetical protein